MKKIFCILFIFLINNILFCQKEKSFIKFFSGDIIDAKNVTYISKGFSKPHFMVDDKKFVVDDVAFYRNEKGFFANIKKINFSESSLYAEKKVSGKINLFSREYSSAPMVMGNSGILMGNVNTTISYYYNKGTFGDLKKSKYRNLKVDLNDNSNSMMHLKKFKSVTQRQTLLYLLGGVITTVGVVSLINNTSNVPQGVAPKTTGSFAIIGTGFITVVINYLTSVNKYKHIKEAIEVYNQ